MSAKEFFVVEMSYIDYDNLTDENIDAGRVFITTIPTKKLFSSHYVVDGPCGENREWSVYAHGVYQTLEEAREAVYKITFGKFRPAGSDHSRYEKRVKGIVEAYKFGEFEPLTISSSIAWLGDRLYRDVNSYTSVAEVRELMRRYEKEANEEGKELSHRLENYILDIVHDMAVDRIRKTRKW